MKAKEESLEKDETAKKSHCFKEPHGPGDVRDSRCRREPQAEAGWQNFWG